MAHPTAAARLVWLGVEVALSRLLAPAAGLSPGREAARGPHGTGVTLGLFLSGKAPSARQAARSLTDQAPSSQDPETAWERLFWRAHPVPAVKLLSVFWASLGAASRIPPEARIRSLPELEEAASGARQVDYDEVRRRIGGLPELPSPVARAEAR